MSAGFINNTKHFAVTDTSTLIQDALNAGRLENPYVALVDGDLDYNSLSPEEPCVIGEWSDDGQGHYTFQILETGDIAWESGVVIGSLADVYFNGGQDAIYMDVMLATMPGSGEWTMTFVEPNESASPSHTFEEGSSESWDCMDVMTSTDSSTASVHVDYDGVDTFEFYQMAQDAPALSMETIDPDCTEDEPL